MLGQSLRLEELESRIIRILRIIVMLVMIEIIVIIVLVMGLEEDVLSVWASHRYSDP